MMQPSLNSGAMVSPMTRSANGSPPQLFSCMAEPRQTQIYNIHIPYYNNMLHAYSRIIYKVKITP